MARLRRPSGDDSQNGGEGLLLPAGAYGAGEMRESWQNSYLPEFHLKITVAWGVSPYVLGASLSVRVFVKVLVISIFAGLL